MKHIEIIVDSISEAGVKAIDVKTTDANRKHVDDFGLIVLEQHADRIAAQLKVLLDDDAIVDISRP